MQKEILITPFYIHSSDKFINSLLFMPNQINYEGCPSIHILLRNIDLNESSYQDSAAA